MRCSWGGAPEKEEYLNGKTNKQNFSTWDVQTDEDGERESLKISQFFLLDALRPGAAKAGGLFNGPLWSTGVRGGDCANVVLCWSVLGPGRLWFPTRPGG